jgi:hypothetical protein
MPDGLPVEEYELSRKYPAAPTEFMSSRERQIIADIINRMAATVIIEIGINEGLTAKYLLDNCPTIEHYVGIDALPGYETGFSQQRHEIPAQGRAGWLVRDDPRVTLLVRSRGATDVKLADLPKADLVLIDGDHFRAAVLHDSALAFAALKERGIVLWHDYKRLDDRGLPDPCNVSDVLEELQRDGEDIKHIAGTWLAMERVEPPPMG